MADDSQVRKNKMYHYYAMQLALIAGLFGCTVASAQKVTGDSIVRNQELSQVVVTGTGTHNRHRFP